MISFHQPEILEGAWKHIAHIYDGDRVKAYVDGQEVLNTQQTDISTMSRTPLSFGYFDQNRTNWYATNFVGLMDDFRSTTLPLANPKSLNFMGMVQVMSRWYLK